MNGRVNVKKREDIRTRIRIKQTVSRRCTVIFKKKGILVLLAVVLLFSFSLVDCAKKPAEPGPGEQMSQTRDLEETPDTSGTMGEYTLPAEDVSPTGQTKGMVPESTREMDVLGSSDLIDVFFALDRSDLTSEGKDKLARNARLLKAASDVKIVVEGHCDERGTTEYNLGLGERRANAVKNYLISLGVSASRIRTISYGEEKPFAAGHMEAAWRQNRRAHFVIN